jgi:hypothetical protein
MLLCAAMKKTMRKLTLSRETLANVTGGGFLVYPIVKAGPIVVNPVPVLPPLPQSAADGCPTAPLGPTIYVNPGMLGGFGF